MKKIYSFFMALSIVLCAMANSPYTMEKQLVASTPTVVKKQAKFNQQDREAIAAAHQAKLAAPSVKMNGVREVLQTTVKQVLPTTVNNKQKAAAQVTEATDTVVIVGNEWTYEYYAETGDWYMAVIDETQTYVVRLDYLAAESEFAGTFTIDDLDLGYSYLTIYDAEGNRTYVDYAEADFTVVVSEEGKFLTANLLGEDGIRYLVSAAELPLPEAKDTVELAYTNATLVDGTRSSSTFQFWADENGIYTSLLIASDQVEGVYTKNDMYVSYANYIMFVEGTDTTFVEFLDLNLTIVKEDQTYFADAYALGVDTTMYHITMSYTKPAPTDTIDIVATNLAIDEFEFWGMVFCTVEASNDEYSVYLDMFNGLPLGELTDADFYLEYSSITRLADETVIGLTEITATVSEVNGQRAIKAQTVGDDNIMYNLDLSFVLPEVTDTVEVTFTTIATAEYYDSSADYYIYNENEEFMMALDIFAEKNNLAGEYAAEDFDLEYTQMAVIEGSDTSIVVILDAKAVITPVSEGVAHIAAELLGEHGELFIVNTDVDASEKGLQYDATEGAIDRTYTLEDAAVLDDQSANGYIMLDVEAADGSDILGLVFWVNGADENTVLPIGTYPINDSMEPGTVLSSSGAPNGSITYSVYAQMDADGYIVTPCWFLVGGEVVVTEANGIVKVEVNAVNSYDVPVHIVCEVDPTSKPKLLYDMTEGEVNRTYSDADIVAIDTDAVAEYGELYLGIDAADGSDMIYVAFYVEAVDPVITIPAGTYPINDSGEYGTVLASPGVMDGYIYPSFYGMTHPEGGIAVPCYFMVDGNVVVENVEGHLKVTIDALNSYNVPAHIVYEADPIKSSVEDIVVENSNARKVMDNNQLFIIKEGVKYNVLGSVVK